MTSKLALGTVQFGLDYGISNQHGQVGLLEGKSIIERAAVASINTLDTAISYGVSEEVLGKIGVSGFNIVTKLPPFPKSHLDPDSWVEGQVIASLKRLGVPKLYGLLVHRSDDLIGNSGVNLSNAMTRVKADGLVQKVGISIYSPLELDNLNPLIRLDLVQSPLSIIDRRLETSGWLSRLHRECVEVHTRSTFLQGLLLMPRDKIPFMFENWRFILDKWADSLEKFDICPTAACLSYPLSIPEVDRVVVGVDSANQLEELIAASQVSIPQYDFSFMSSEDQMLIDPSKWSPL